MPNTVPKDPMDMPMDSMPSQDLLVVVIDDNSVVLEAMKLCLEGWEVDCIAGLTAFEAMQHLERSGRRPDLLLSDYNLGKGQFGDEAIKMVRARYGEDIPAMLFTADTVFGTSEIRKKTDLERTAIIAGPMTGRVLKDAVLSLKARKG